MYATQTSIGAIAKAPNIAALQTGGDSDSTTNPHPGIERWAQQNSALTANPMHVGVRQSDAVSNTYPPHLSGDSIREFRVMIIPFSNNSSQIILSYFSTFAPAISLPPKAALARPHSTTSSRLESLKNVISDLVNLAVTIDSEENSSLEVPISERRGLLVIG